MYKFIFPMWGSEHNVTKRFKIQRRYDSLDFRNIFTKNEFNALNHNTYYIWFKGHVLSKTLKENVLPSSCVTS